MRRKRGNGLSGRNPGCVEEGASHAQKMTIVGAGGTISTGHNEIFGVGSLLIGGGVTLPSNRCIDPGLALFGLLTPRSVRPGLALSCVAALLIGQTDV